MGITGSRNTAVKAVITSALLLAILPGLSAASAESPWSNASPPPATSEAEIPAVPGELHVTAAGDYSSSKAAAAVLSRIGTIKPDLHVALGDLSYGADGAEKSWCDFVTARTGKELPFELVAGNHESNGQNGHIDDFAACLPNRLPGVVGTYGRQYYVDVPQQNPVARFVFVSPGIPFSNGNWDYSAGSPRYNWTADAIDGARAASIPWVVASMHTPCFTMGRYGCQAGEDLTNLLLSKKVDLVLNGHEHLYQRSKQLSTGGNCPSMKASNYSEPCVKDKDNSLAKGAGTVFTTVGTGGASIRNVNTADTEAAYFAAYSGLNANPSHGLINLKFTTTSLTAEFVATDGTFADKFRIGS